MKEWILLIFFLIAFFNSFGQYPVFDPDFRKPPLVKLDIPDSVKQIKISETYLSGMSKEPLKYPGYLARLIDVDKDGRVVSVEYYDALGSEITESFAFDYEGESNLYIKQIERTGRKAHWWYFRDSLIQQVKVFVGSKRKLKGQWTYNYLNDTLPTSLVKYNRDSIELYKMQYQYSEENQLITEDIIEKGELTRSYNVQFDEDGNFLGYTEINNQRPGKSNEVTVERDSSDQITGVTKETFSGKAEKWNYEHNNSGQLVRATKFNKDIEVIITYNEQGRKINEQYFKNGKEKARLEWAYDDNENMISRHYYERLFGNLELLTYLLFTYDKRNRLVRKDSWNKSGIRHRWDYEYLFY